MESKLKRIQNLTLDTFCTKNGLVVASSGKRPIKADYITSILRFVSKHSKDEECIMTTKVQKQSLATPCEVEEMTAVPAGRKYEARKHKKTEKALAAEQESYGLVIR